MESIYNYIAYELDSPLTAMHQYDRIAAGIESLSQFPLRNRLFDCQPEHDMGIRSHFINNYSVIYVVKLNSVTVLRFLYSQSDIISRLRKKPIIDYTLVMSFHGLFHFSAVGLSDTRIPS